MGNAAAVNDDRFAGLDIGGHRPERNRQLLKIADPDGRFRESPEKRLDGNTGDDPLRQREAAALDAVLGSEQCLVVVDLDWLGVAGG